MLRQLKKSTPYLMLCLITSLAMGLSEGYVFIRMMALFDEVLAGQMETFMRHGIEVMLLALLLVPLSLVFVYSKNLCKRKVNESLKTKYLEDVFKKDISSFSKDNNGKYISVLNNDFNVLEVKLVEAVLTCVDAGSVFLAGIWMVSKVNPWLILLGVGLVGLNGILTAICNKPVSKQTSIRSELFEGYTAYIKEVLSAFHIIKNNQLQDRIHENFYAKSEKVQEKGYIIDKLLTRIYSIERINNNMVITLIMCIVGYMTIMGYATVGGLLLAVEGVQRMIYPVMMITEALPNIFSVKKLINKIEKTLEEKQVCEEHIELKSVAKEIRLENVSFGYEDHLVLEHAYANFKKGGKYLIVGPSGGGKSTVLKLLRKYFNPLEGTVWLGDTPLKTITKESYFNHIANVEQQVFIFEDTLLNNIALYKTYEPKELQEAIDKAGLNEFVTNHPDGLNRMLYENGKNISGGEKSRIAIARALLQKAEMILLDEAFSALDAKRAREIERILLGLEGVTVIQVSHVLFEENKKAYDQIYKVKHKKITALMD